MSMHRRAFLAASLAGGCTAAAFAQGTGPGTSLPVPNNLSKTDLATPALLVDLPAFEANLRAMADHCRKAGCAFRPHAKTHKCPEIARRQVAAGALGVCVATVPEAEAMAAAGVRGVLLTSPIVEPRKLARMIELARQPGQVLLALGHAREADLLNEAADAARLTVEVLIDLDVGDRRTGVLPGQPALQLARHAGKLARLRVVGVQAYAGHASHTVGFERRSTVSRTAMTQALETRDLLVNAGFNLRVVSGGSTGTYNIDSGLRGVTELQVGSYVFMDVDYRRIGGRNNQAVYTDFQPSLTVLTTVVSATHADRVTVDAGTKAFSTDVSWAPEAKNWDGLTYRRAGDEFGTVTAAQGARLPRLGDRLEFLVPHCDPTVNLYNRLYAMRGEKVEAIWPVLARKENVRT
jgi:D-serine deaminase-like pyridoxal phosphate-dependent protein